MRPLFELPWSVGIAAVASGLFVLQRLRARKGFSVHELAAGRVQSSSDALVAVEPAIGTREFPTDPVARLAVSAAETMHRRGGGVAVL